MTYIVRVQGWREVVWSSFYGILSSGLLDMHKQEWGGNFRLLKLGSHAHAAHHHASFMPLQEFSHAEGVLWWETLKKARCGDEIVITEMRMDVARLILFYGDVLYRWLNAGCSDWLNNNWLFPWYLFLGVQSRIIWCWRKRAKSEDSILCDILTPYPGCIVHLRCEHHRWCDWKWLLISRTMDAGRILWAIKYKLNIKY